MINVTCGTGSTGRICTDIAVALENRGHNVKIAYGRDSVPDKYKKYAIRIGNDMDVKLHVLKARLVDGMGFGSRKATERFIEWVKKYNPDVIHLHNIHGYYINIEVLFKYLNSCKKRVIWTLHDCWSFTGHCAYFDYVGCNRWKNGCFCCPQKKEYPARIGIDQSKHNYRIKKKLFLHMENMIFVTPSNWLANLLKDSFLEKYPVQVINNGINTSLFKPTVSNIRKKYEIRDDVIVVLGVASVWDKRKGLEDFEELAEILDENYKIVLIGLTKMQIGQIPEAILGIERTESIQELVNWYSTADVFVNPTYEDNYPTTNVEAISCGTPIVTYNTGGSSEIAHQFGGRVLDNKNARAIAEAIDSVIMMKKEMRISSGTNDITLMVSKYMDLYENKV